ncbi:hypothetical protein NQ176_g847 [Zarea fungicola]|uniref:Uncharacterized protein n=1 Tax=Zarea fungicola TaxID=93591 RepID=A0ACC1NWP1_9HYPO|nr:hypothetical protein NQ176_g847 [Lecanicillium fungicola]
MAIYRVFLFKLKDGVTQEQIQEANDAAKQLETVIPGLISINVGPALEMSQTKGFDMGVIMQMESLEHVKLFATHPEHKKVQKLREAISEGDSLAFMLEYQI